MENTNITVTNLQHKSNAPWILGIIAFCMSIPNALCAVLCAGAAHAATTSPNDPINYIELETMKGNGVSRVPYHEPDERITGLLLAVILVSILCFVLSFFGKSKISIVTGFLLILMALFIIVNGWVGFGSMLWGTITGLLYFISGIFSIINKKRIA